MANIPHSGTLKVVITSPLTSIGGQAAVVADDARSHNDLLAIKEALEQLIVLTTKSQGDK